MIKLENHKLNKKQLEVIYFPQFLGLKYHCTF